MAQHRLVTVRVLDPRRELATGRGAIQILEFGLPAGPYIYSVPGG